jgi:hypothetical protein
VAKDKAAQARLKARVASRERDIERLANDLSRTFERGLGRVLRRLQDAQKGTDGELSAVEAASLVNTLEAELEAGGFNRQLRRQFEMFEDELDGIAEELEARGIDSEFGGTDLELALELARFSTDKTASTIERLIGDSKGILYRSYILGETVDVSQIMENFGDRTFAHVKTELNTTFATFARTVTAAKADELGITLFLYIGPDDDLTRDFCAEVLERDPPIYTRDEIDSMDNEQGLDVMDSAGGWNCRHQWSPLTREAAKTLGYTGD